MLTVFGEAVKLVGIELVVVKEQRRFLLSMQLLYTLPVQSEDLAPLLDGHVDPGHIRYPRHSQSVQDILLDRLDAQLLFECVVEVQDTGVEAVEEIRFRCRSGRRTSA